MGRVQGKMVYESQMTSCGSHFSPSTLWVLRVKNSLQVVALAFKVKVFYLWSLHPVGGRQKIK